MPACPKCGSEMVGGAPYGPWPVQYECRRCGNIVVPTQGGGTLAGAVFVIDPPDDDDADDDDLAFDEEFTPLEDDHDYGDPVGEYDDARNLNAADIMAEIRRMT